MNRPTFTKSKSVSVDDLSRQIDILKSDIADFAGQLKRVGKTKAEEFIRTQPAIALGIASGVGFLIGLATAQP